MSLPGFTILHSRYLLGYVLGSGGFGITYKAWDMARRQVCAVKEYLPMGLTLREGKKLVPVGERWASEYDHGKQRFVQEAQALIRCRGIPQVVDVEECFEQHNTVYYAMEYLGGGNLNMLMRQRGGMLPFQEAWAIIKEAGLGLEALHEKFQIFHRDVSPENIMIAQNGKVKLIDFGSVKELMAGLGGDMTVVLKHGFAPPEQYRCGGVQGCFTDVYALAATFYAAATGRKLPDAMARMTGVAYKSIKILRQDIPPRISDAVDHALKLSVKERTPTVRAFFEEAEGGSSQILPYILIDTDGRTGKTYRRISPNREILIGRDEELCQVILKDPRISAMHLEVRYDEKTDAFYIRDCDSRNGTFYQGQRLQGQTVYRVAAGTWLELGYGICRIQVGIGLPSK